MKPFLSLCFLAACLAQSALADIQTDWAYHAIGNESSATERVPGEDTLFLANGTGPIVDGDAIILFVLTAHDFAEDMDEQVFVRWWDGSTSHWIMGTWVKTLQLDSSRPDARFRGLPAEGTATLDLWKIEIPAGITQPGENFYAIQLKGCTKDNSEDRYLLNKRSGDFSHTNNFGQVWSASEEFDGQDWIINIWE